MPTHGVVYEGEVMPKEEKKLAPTAISLPISDLYPVTATKIYMNLGEPSVIEKY
jgi:pyruvate,water dikinase